MALFDDIINKVTSNELATLNLRRRWDSDYSLWRLDPYTGAGEGWKSYTSNEPRTNAQKAIGMLSAAVMILQVPQHNDDRRDRDVDNAKERFLLGNFKANDRRLVRSYDNIMLQQYMAWCLMVRGTTCGRSLFIRHPSGRVWADATPWDPRATFWEYGDDGLDWICNRQSMLRSAAEKRWSKLPKQGDNRENEEILTIYDFYDTEKNIVLVTDESKSILKDERHGLVDGNRRPMVPAWVMANTLQPKIPGSGASEGGAFGSSQHGGTLTKQQFMEPLVDFGESIYAASRHQFEADQFIASVRMELTSRSRNPVFSLKSASGVKVVEYDPWKDGAEIPLGTDEELIIHDAIKSAPDTDPLANQVAREEQKSLFPAVSFGNLPDPISGFAINNLKGGVADKVLGGAQAMAQAYMMITDNWSDHFNTRAFGGIELSGLGRNRKWFSGFTTPDDLEDLPSAEIEFVPELPEDQAGQIQNALALRTPGVDGMPLEPDYIIREEWLKRQDSDMDFDAILQQMAAQNPLVKAQRFTDALANRGDEEGAKAWHVMWQMQMLQLQQALAQQGVSLEKVMATFNPDTNQTRTNGQEQNNISGYSPDVLPPQAQGIPSPTPGVNTPAQAGPLVPGGTPRPGAQAGGGGFDPFSRE